MLKVLDPVGPAGSDRFGLAERADTLDGLRLGVLANGKPNAANLLHIAQERLQERYRISEVVFLDKMEAKLTANDAIPDWMLERLQACGAVLHGSGD